MRVQTKRVLSSLVGIALAGVVVYGNETSFIQQSRPLDLTGRQVDPFRPSDAKAIVFLFVRTDCPVSNRYAPEVRRLNEKFAARGVIFRLVYPDPDTSVEAVRKHVKEYDYHLDVLRDPQHTLVRMAGVRVTPEAAVFVTEGNGRRMVYRGRIDNRHVAFGKARPAPTTRDLEATLDSIVEGKPVTATTNRAIGCFISDLPR
ncbi:MAG: redoxin domain-containing protein [Acidobacteriota bacterium]|nr:redoxin domain-containing protein [Acidobacteriota bacterium]